MADQQGFVRLNKEQKRLLRALKPLDGVEGGLARISAEGVKGFEPIRALPVLYELRELNYVLITNDEQGDPCYVCLSSWAYCYRWEYFMNLVVPVILQMLGGVSGGFVVWLLTKLSEKPTP